MPELERILQELSVVDGWHEVSALADRLNALVAPWPPRERESAIEDFVDGCRGRSTYRYER